MKSFVTTLLCAILVALVTVDCEATAPQLQITGVVQTVSPQGTVFTTVSGSVNSNSDGNFALKELSNEEIIVIDFKVGALNAFAELTDKKSHVLLNQPKLEAKCKCQGSGEDKCDTPVLQGKGTGNCDNKFCILLPRQRSEDRCDFVRSADSCGVLTFPLAKEFFSHNIGQPAVQVDMKIAGFGGAGYSGGVAFVGEEQVLSLDAPELLGVDFTGKRLIIHENVDSLFPRSILTENFDFGFNDVGKNNLLNKFPNVLYKMTNCDKKTVEITGLNKFQSGIGDQLQRLQDLGCEVVDKRNRLHCTETVQRRVKFSFSTIGAFELFTQESPFGAATVGSCDCRIKKFAGAGSTIACDITECSPGTFPVFVDGTLIGTFGCGSNGNGLANVLSGVTVGRNVSAGSSRTECDVENKEIDDSPLPDFTLSPANPSDDVRNASFLDFLSFNISGAAGKVASVATYSGLFLVLFFIYRFVEHVRAFNDFCTAMKHCGECFGTKRQHEKVKNQEQPEDSAPPQKSAENSVAQV